MASRTYQSENRVGRELYFENSSLKPEENLRSCHVLAKVLSASSRQDGYLEKDQYLVS